MTKDPSYGARTDVGRVRPENEDSLIASPPLFAVADGMGGYEAGEVASEVAVNTLLAQAPAQIDPRALGRAVMAANIAVIRAAEDGTGKPGMGTTMTATMVDGTRVIVAQVGDSRAYVLHAGALTQITRDHSLMADLIEAGQITEEEARWHPQRSVITRALGSDPDMVPDLYDLEMEEGDRILLCSDGLSGMVYDDEIASIMNANPDPQRCADELIDAANRNGGHDNVTAVVVCISTEKMQLAETKRKSKSRTLVLGFVIALVAAIFIAGFALYGYARSNAYLITENGYVTVYRGLAGNLGPLHLSWYDSTTDVAANRLPSSIEDQLDAGIQVDSLDAAYDLVSSYEEQIAVSTKAVKSTTGSSSGTSTTGTGTTTGTSTTGTGTSSNGTATSSSTSG